MTQVQQPPTPSSTLAMLDIRNQRCSHGNARVAQTAFEMSAIEALGRDLLSPVMICDTDDKVRFDLRMLGVFQPAVLHERAKTGLQAQPDLRLSSDLTCEAIHKRADLVKELQAGRRPDLAEQISGAVSGGCQEAGQHLRRTFDAAADRAPSKVDEVADDLVKGLDQMAVVELGDGQAIARFIRRAEQLDGLPRWRSELPAATYESLERQLLQTAQMEYNLAFDWIVAESFHQAWQAERDAFKARVAQYRDDTQAFRAKNRLCTEGFERAHQRAKQRATTLRSGNQVFLGEASDDELRAALLAHRKAGSQIELLQGLRHDLDEKLRERALRRGMGPESQQAPFRRLVLSLPVDDLVETFREILLAGVSGTHSLYEACQAYGLERLVTELVQRSHITSWFDGRDDPRFGITTFEFKMVRLPAPDNPKEVAIRKILETLFRQAGFHDILSSRHSHSISILRLYIGWPLGVEGGNGVLLQAYGRSARTGHLPHLVGILADSQAGKHAPRILRLLGALESGVK